MTPEATRLLVEHRRRVDGLFDDTPEGFVNWVDTRTGRAIIDRWGPDVVSAAIAAAAARTTSDPEDVERAYFLNAELLEDQIARRTWVTTTADAALMVNLASDPNCGYYEIRIALRFAEKALAAHPNHPGIMDALLRLGVYLDSNPLHVTGFFIAKVGPWLSRLVAQQTPSGLLDLGFIDQRCAWGKAAGLAISHWAESEPAGEFALHLGSPRGTRASKTWWSDTQAAMNAGWRRDLVAELSGYLTTTDLTPRDDQVDGLDAPEEQLVVVANQLFARGVVWAETFATDSDAAHRVGQVVERAAVPFLGWDGSAPRCSKVALAGIQALTNSAHPEARRELQRLFSRVPLALLIRRVGQALDLPEQDIKDQIKRNRFGR